MKQTVLVSLFLSVAVAGHAQTWDDDFENQPTNIRYGSYNPTRITYNPICDFAVANVNYSLSKGDFHAVDESGDVRNLGAYIKGLRHIGKFDVEGHLGYQNLQENKQSWNSTLWLRPYNPFVLCDSVEGDASTEWFDVHTAATYTFNDRLKAGLELGLRTGSRADQTDPRPRTTTSVVPITVGADYQLGNQWNLGLAAGVRLYSSVIEYTKGATHLAVAHRYFLMKGMGDYAKRSSGDESGYKRDYQGTDYHVALSAVWQPADSRIGNFMEIGFSSNHQDATDGGISYSFHGGDYDENVVSLQDRLLWKPSANALHNLTLNASYAKGTATWFDQKRETDLEHGGVVLYRVLSESTIQENQRLDASLDYQLDLLRNQRRDLTINAKVGLHNLNRKQYQGLVVPEQKIQYVDLQAQAAKAIYINKVSLWAQVGGGYRLSGTSEYANGSAYTGEDDIQQPYTRRVFEYESCSRANVHALVDASIPAGKKLTAGAYAKGNVSFYADNEEYWQGYDGKSLTTVEAGVYLKF